MNKIILRLIFDIIIIIALIQGWWIVILLFGIAGAWMFPYYIELFIAGLIYDSLFGLEPNMGVRGYLGIIITAALLLTIGGVKKIVRR